MRLILLAGVLIGGCAMASGSAIAQSNLSEPALRGGAPKAPAPNTKAAEPPPAAVPGARARPDSVVPADRTTADLPPTEALFDAINRGDIASARDALSRGADLDATNLLGLTPTELSVDLARNDITFLLLSLRGGSSSVHGPQIQQTEAAPPQPSGRTRRRQASRSQLAEKPAPIEAASKRQSPVLFAGNGGTANPSVGFLGFDPSH